MRRHDRRRIGDTAGAGSTFRRGLRSVRRRRGRARDGRRSSRARKDRVDLRGDSVRARRDLARAGRVRRADRRSLERRDRAEQPRRFAPLSPATGSGSSSSAAEAALCAASSETNGGWRSRSATSRSPSSSSAGSRPPSTSLRVALDASMKVDAKTVVQFCLDVSVELAVARGKMHEAARLAGATVAPAGGARLGPAPFDEGWFDASRPIHSRVARRRRGRGDPARAGADARRGGRRRARRDGLAGLSAPAPPVDVSFSAPVRPTPARASRSAHGDAPRRAGSAFAPRPRRHARAPRAPRRSGLRARARWRGPRRPSPEATGCPSRSPRQRRLHGREPRPVRARRARRGGAPRRPGPALARPDAAATA